MFATILAAIAAFEEVFGRENNVTLRGLIEIIGFQIASLAYAFRVFAHGVKVGILPDYGL